MFSNIVIDWTLQVVTSEGHRLTLEQFSGLAVKAGDLGAVKRLCHYGMARISDSSTVFFIEG